MQVVPLIKICKAGMVFPGRLCYAVIMEELMSVDKSLGMQESGRIPKGIYEPLGEFKIYDEIIFVICYFRSYIQD